MVWNRAQTMGEAAFKKGRVMQKDTPSNSSKEAKCLVHFAHANGFPAQSYRKLFDHIDSSYQLIALDKFGHNPAFPLNNNWQNQVEELVEYVKSEQQQVAQKGSAELPVVLVGHSFGAVISFLAVCKYPHMFAGLIMLDPPLVTGMASWVFKLAKRGKLIDRITPAGKTKIRNSKWHHKTDLVSYFHERALFKNMDKECISDYVEAVTRVEGDYRHLHFDVDIETNIFRTLPDNLSLQKGKLQVPSYLLTGKNTEVCVPRLRNRFIGANSQHIRHIELPFGGHMFPLEKPVEVAITLNDLLAQLCLGD